MNNYEKILKELNSQRKELVFNASLLDTLSSSEREVIEDKILLLCRYGNISAMNYLPYLKNINTNEYLKNIIDDKVQGETKNYIRLYLYIRTNNKKYLDSIDYDIISPEFYVELLKYYRDKNDSNIKSVIDRALKNNRELSRLYNLFINKDNNNENKILSSIVGFAIGDALGVPVEFTERSKLKINPVRDMQEYGTHSVPKGTWSDDTSMTLATMSSIIKQHKIDYESMMTEFCNWAYNQEYTANDTVFDIGITTNGALSAYYYMNKPPLECGDKREYRNGNGSLMRMLPIAIYLSNKKLSEDDEVTLVNNLSSLTHASETCKLGCKIFCDFMKSIIMGLDKNVAYNNLKNHNYTKYYPEEIIEKYSRILKGDIAKINVDSILSSGYIVSTLEASIWCTLKSNTFEEAVLKAVNLGNDTDTVGAITGGINGYIYGKEAIPKKWLKDLKKLSYIEKLSNDYTNELNHNVSDISKPVNDKRMVRQDFPKTEFRLVYDNMTPEEMKAKKEMLDRKRKETLLELGYTILDDGTIVKGNSHRHKS